MPMRNLTMWRRSPDHNPPSSASTPRSASTWCRGPKDGLNLTPEGYANRFVTTVGTNHGELTKSVEVLRDTAPVISLKCYEWGFSGGAHGWSSLSYLNFDLVTGEPVKLSAILKEGALPRLTSIAEGYFRKVRENPPAGSLSDAGFTFPGNQFKLNDNFGLSETSLFFTFNDYEIGPHTMGSTTIEIPLDEIRYLMQLDFTP